MTSMLIERVKKLQDKVNRLNRFNKLICDCNQQLREKASCLDENNCDKQSCAVNQFQKIKKLQDQYEKISRVDTPIIAIKRKKLEDFDETSSGKKYQCNVNGCGKKFNCNSRLKRHLISH